MLGKDAILSGACLKVEEIDVPEWGGKVRIRELGGGDLAFFQSTLNPKGGETLNVGESIDAYATLLALSVVGEDGQPLFSRDDIPKLKTNPLRILQAIGGACFKLNGMGEVDAAEKN